MHLHRVTPDAFENYNYSADGKYLGQEANYFKASELSYSGREPFPVVVARFDRFGGGTHRKSDYEVLSEWQDVEELIAKFCDAGHPEAIFLKTARELAAAVEAAGWQRPVSE